MPNIFITKFALKSGIVEASANIDPQGKASVQGAFPWLTASFSKSDYTLDEESAKTRVAGMAIARANKLEREAAWFRALAAKYKGE